MMVVWGVVFMPTAVKSDGYISRAITNAAVMKHFTPRRVPAPGNDNEELAA